MRGGWILLAGIIGLVAALGMDTSVSTEFGRVNNIGLMKDQQNYVLIASLAIVAGLIMLAVQARNPEGSSGQSNGPNKACPECAETIKRDARVCRFCGHRQAPLFTAEYPDTTSTKPKPTAWQRLWWNPHAESKRRK